MKRKTRPHGLAALLIAAINCSALTGLRAQAPPTNAPPRPLVITNLPLPAYSTNPATMSTNEAEEMIRALRRAMTSGPAPATTTRQMPQTAPAPRPATTPPATNAPSTTAPATAQPPVIVTPAAPVVTPAIPTPQAAPAQPATIPQPGQTPPVIQTPVLPGQAPAVPAPAPGQVPAPGQAPAPQQIPADQPAPEQVISSTLIQVQGMPLDQFFEIYSMISGRTVLRPYELPNTSKGITLKAQTDWTRQEAIFAMDAALALNGVAMIPVDQKFVRAVPAAQAPTEGAELKNLRPSDYVQTEQFVTQVIELKTVKPSEVAQLLASFSKIPNSITPFDNNNTIVLREYASNVKRMMEVLNRIDVERESDYKLEVIPIRYGKVTDLYNTMASLISGQAGTGFGATGTGGSQRTGARSGRLGVGGGGGMGTSRLGTSAQRYGQQGMSPLQQQQPVQSVGGAQSTFQNRLQQIVQRAAGGPEMELLQDARIVPDERSNTLLLFANKRDIDMITNIVAKVDVLLAQVLIEAIILEVKLNDSFNLGVSMLQQPRRFGGDFTGAGGVNNGQPFLSGITNLAGGLPSGFSYFGKIGNELDVAVTAIARDSEVKVTSRPRVQTSHGIPGEFIIAESVPYVTALSDYGGFVSGGLTRSQVDYLDIGVQLYVTPYITPEGYVVMEIEQSFSQRGPDVTIDGNPYPSLNNRQTTSMLTVRDGDTIMMGGFITESKNRSKSGVPLLKDIPGLGVLFRSKNSSGDRTELIVLMRAKVLENPRDAAMTAAHEKEQLPGLQQAEREFQESDRKARKKVESRRKW